MVVCSCCTSIGAGLLPLSTVVSSLVRTQYTTAYQYFSLLTTVARLATVPCVPVAPYSSRATATYITRTFSFAFPNVIATLA